MSTTSAHQRRDAERNHEAIVTAAIAVLADAPEATMAEIAAASGIGRSTLYRHFPDRAALVDAISLRVRAEARPYVAFQNNLVDEDPGFVDAAKMDFRLPDDSPVYKKVPGFKKIPFETIGLVPCDSIFRAASGAEKNAP